MAAKPVHYKLDPDRRAPAIYCEVCDICHWRPIPRVPRRQWPCFYGGPFAGYRYPNGEVPESLQLTGT